MSKSSRSEEAVLEELEQTMENVVKREKELQKAIKTLESSKKRLAHKKEELALKNQEVQEQVDSLMHEFETTIKKRKLDLAGQERQARTEAFSAMVQEAEEELAEATAAIKTKTEEYGEIDKTVRKLRQRKGLLTNIAEADRKISLIQLVKDNLNDLSGATSENSQDQEIIDEIVQKLKRENTYYRESFLDDLIRQEEQILTQKLGRAGENRESLNDFAQELIQASTEAQTEPSVFLDNLILVGNTEKQEKLEEITALEKKENALEENLKKLKKLELDIDRIEIPEEIAEKLARQKRLILQREKEVRAEVIVVDNSGQSEIGEIVNELHTLEENVKRQEQTVKDARKSLYQTEERFSQLQKELDELVKQHKTTKKQQEEVVPEQFYPSTSRQFPQLSETIKHRKELNRLKREHAEAQALLEEQITQLQQESLQQQSSGPTKKDLELAKRLNQEQQERIKELEEQIIDLTLSSAPSLTDELRELEEHSDTEKLSELQALIEKQNAEIAALKERAEAAERNQQAKQEELDAIQARLEDLDQEKRTLTQQLSEAQQAIKKGGGDKEALEAEVAQLLQKIKTNDEAQKQQIASLTEARELAEKAAREASKAYEQQIAALRKEVETGTSQVQALQEKIQQKNEALEQEQSEHQTALQGIQGKLDKAISDLELARENGERGTTALQKQVEQLTREKDELVKKNKLAAQHEQDEISRLESEKTQALAELRASKDAEIAALKERAEAAERNQQAKQEELDAIQARLEDLDQEKRTLTQQLSEAQQAIKKGGGDKEALKAEVTRLTQQLEAAKQAELQAQKAAKEAREALDKANKEHQNVLEAEKAARKPLTQLDETPKKVPTQKPVKVQTPATNKISDNVSIVSGDQILRDFRELRRMQRDVVVGSQTIADAPEGNEAFHKYASQHGADIGNGLDPEISELMGAIEREKYQEIHRKYPHSDIEWQGGNQASITRDGIEICKLNNKPVAASDHATYKLGETTIANYRNLDLPVQAKGGPMHMSLAVKDLQGKNISDKDAVYLTAHYDKEGKLVEMTTPIPVYFTGTDKDSPVCIKRKGKIYTLPVNRGKYEEMIKKIEINKGIETSVGKGTKTQDRIILGPKTSKVKSLVPPQVVTTLKPHTTQRGAHTTIVSRKKRSNIERS